MDEAEALNVAAAAAGVPLRAVGRFGGNIVRLGGSEASLGTLSEIYRTAFARAIEG
jgi:phosphoribosylformylglycinamidine synthase